MSRLQSEFLAAAASECADNADTFFQYSGLCCQYPDFCYLKSFREGNFYLCVEQGVSLLDYCQKIDNDTYNQIHKGFPYFWIGIAALMVHDYEKALCFVDSAVLEDQRNINLSTRGRPLATAFCILEKNGVNPYVDQLLDNATDLISYVIDKYNDIDGREVTPISLDEVRGAFLIPAFSRPGSSWRTIATTFISFILEWEDRRKIRSLLPTEATSETFFLHLFKGALLFESLLKAVNPACYVCKKEQYLPLNCQNATLGEILNSTVLFDNKSCCPFWQELLHLDRQPNIGKKTLPEILASLETRATSVTMCVETTGRIRNTTGHFLGWIVDLNRDNYDALVEMISITCLHTIACLYRAPKGADSC